ncbi:MAG TPA: hypothetical protein GXX40_07820 [Firmicutes bacterium]|nr:hypothetical protein [Bacillota bacterium]
MNPSVEELVNLITQQVLKNLAKPVEAKPAGGPGVLLLFCGGTAGLDVVSTQLAEMAKLGCEYHCVFSRAGANVVGTDFVSTLKPRSCIVEGDSAQSVFALVNKCKLVVVPVLTQNTCAKAALGIRDSLASDTLAAAFLLGRPVLIATDAIPTEGVPAAYRQMILSHLKTLESFGARLVRAAMLAQQVKALLEGAPPEGVQTPKSTISGKPLPTKLVDLRVASEWVKEKGVSEAFVVEPGTIITPLAADFLRERKVLVVRRAGEMSC